MYDKQDDLLEREGGGGGFQHVGSRGGHRGFRPSTEAKPCFSKHGYDMIYSIESPTLERGRYPTVAAQHHARKTEL